tara:strand:+ start:172 stop:1437 length:1266 start_codon:yes stop_codon:yes gene_type:complete
MKMPLDVIITIDDKLGNPLSKYLEWVLKLIKKFEIEMEDLDGTISLLTRFAKYKNKKKWGKPTDINQYKSAPHLFTAVREYEQENPVEGVSKSDPSKLSGNTKLGSKDGKTLWKLESYEDFQIFNPKNDSEWCVAYPKSWKEYSPPYYLLNSNPTATLEDAVLLHIESAQCMDLSDSPVNPSEQPFKELGLDLESIIYDEVTDLESIIKVMKNKWYPKKMEELKRKGWDMIVDGNPLSLTFYDRLLGLRSMFFFEGMGEDVLIKLVDELDSLAEDRIYYFHDILDQWVYANQHTESPAIEKYLIQNLVDRFDDDSSKFFVFGKEYVSSYVWSTTHKWKAYENLLIKHGQNVIKVGSESLTHKAEESLRAYLNSRRGNESPELFELKEDFRDKVQAERRKKEDGIRQRRLDEIDSEYGKLES